ncbi:MAG: hypothetical protein L3J41_04815 [Melioribacteraceae bacterium]|nr:hypothetical protein [Melioribacteraceae bacterium]
MITLKTKIIFFFLILTTSVFTQGRTNLELLNSLVDSSALSISSKLSDSTFEYNVEYQTVAEYSALNKRFENSLVRSGITVSFDKGNNKISYSILRASVNYSDLFKDGLLGGYLLERKFILSGEYAIKNSSTVLSADTFYYTITDTIPYNSLNFVENNSLPFTKSSVPSEPFFPSMLEPIVAITAVVVTVVLFFTVRSN